MPRKRPLRPIKVYIDWAFNQLPPMLDGIYSHIDCSSIPPERVIKAQLLMAAYSPRSDGLFCEVLEYNIMFQWFLDMGLEEASIDGSTFGENRERLTSEEVTFKFFDWVIREVPALERIAYEHFSVNGAVIEAWASIKSFRPKDGGAPGTDALAAERTATHVALNTPRLSTSLA